MNQNTRPMYDKLTTTNRNAITQKPMRYMVNSLTEHRTLNEPAPESINVSNDLRMKPTRLNEFNRPETELFGTAPFKGLGHRNVVDVESNLMFSEQNKHCNRTLTERMWETNDYMNDALPVDSAVRPSSTRSQLRNEYTKVNSRSHNMNTHKN